MDLGFERDAEYRGLEEKLVDHVGKVHKKKVRELRDELEALERQNRALRDENSRLRNTRVSGPSGSRQGTPKLTLLQSMKCDDKVHSVATWKPTWPQWNRVAADVNTPILAASCWDGNVHLWDRSALESNASKPPVAHKYKIGKKETPAGGYCVSFCKRDPDLVGIASSDGNIYMYNHVSKTSYTLDPVKQGARQEGAEVPDVQCIDFHAGQNVLAAAVSASHCAIWDYSAPSPSFLRKLETPDEPEVYGCSFFDENSDLQYCVATLSYKENVHGSLRIWDMRSSKVVSSFSGGNTAGWHTDDVNGIDFSPQLWQLATGSDDGKIILYDIRSMGDKHRVLQIIDTRPLFPGTHNEVKRVKFAPDRNMLAAGCSVGCAALFDLRRHEKLYAVGKSCGPEGPDDEDKTVFDVAWHLSQSGELCLATASHDKNVCLFSVPKTAGDPFH
eukprot:TRINITY_DN35036_c0_g1_i1.p1 TRINITY_DN35036_c0_g1~~TRINITY_DN35036_c0_g1_i1.p1  ORF type:complete len:445 (+),score=86.30 TRINITY_DN35036_c0_g1_i1:101-1435(+)